MGKGPWLAQQAGLLPHNVAVALEEDLWLLLPQNLAGKEGE